MRNFILSTDGTCDLSPETFEKYGIPVLPMEYVVDGVGYGGESGKELPAKDFYRAMREGKATHTSMVNAEDGERYFTRLLSEGKDVVHLCFASACSGTYDCLVKVAEKLSAQGKNRVEIVDSMSQSGGEGLLLLYGAEYAETHSARQTVDYLNAKKHQINHLFTVDDLQYLARGGRVSKSGCIIGNALMIKPLLHTDPQGYLKPYGKVITRKTALLQLARQTVKQMDENSDRVIVSHADCEEDAKTVAEKIEKLSGKKCEIMKIGYVIGCHSGPGTIAVFFASESRVLR